MFDCDQGLSGTLRAKGVGLGLVILGIDPGLAHTGWGVIERSGSQVHCLAYGCVTTRAQEAVAQRLAAIYEAMNDVVDRYRPEECAVESVFFGANAKSAFATGQARGVALLATAGARLVVGDYSPVQIKSTVVGSGTADKQQVQYMVKVTLGLDHVPRPDHAADALAAAITHAQLRDRAALEAAARAEASR
jgi:crossover junction endodeoxyribonuclease RuvC